MCMFRYFTPRPIPLPIPLPIPVFLPVGEKRFKELIDRSVKNEPTEEQKTRRLPNQLEMPPSVDEFFISTDKEHNLTLGAQLFQSFVQTYRRKDPSIPKTFPEFSVEQLSKSLLRFAIQLKKSDGTLCSPEVLYFVSVSVHYFLRSIGREEDILYDPEFNAFSQFVFDRIQHCTVQIDPRDNRVYSRINEEILWKSYMLGAHSPRTLLNTLFYINIKCFLILNIQDHYDLTFANVRRHVKRWVVPIDSEDQKLNESESSHNENQHYKEVSRQRFIRYYPTRDPDLIFEQIEDRSFAMHCACRIFEFYISKCPVSLRHSEHCIYLEPEKSVMPESPIWFTSKAVSEMTLTKMMLQTRLIKEMSELEIAFASQSGSSTAAGQTTAA
ncbi:hypothetical protein ACOME3_010666 [Neoechinorhynchus agilis]